MGVVRSQGEDAESMIASATERLLVMVGQEGAQAKQAALKELCSGADIQLHAPAGSDRLAVYTAYLAASVGTTLIVTGSEEAANAIKEFLSERSVSAVVAAEPDDIRNALSEANGCVVAPVAVAAAAFKGAKKVGADRCIVDSVESIVSDATIGELEAFLLGFREVSSEAQLVLIAVEPSLNLSALSRRFLNDPKTCSIKGALVKDMEHIYYEVGTTLLAKPQALCDLVELESGSTCIVFCNSPSDADFADVILKKRGLSSVKLIGYVPQIKLSKAIHQIQKKEVTVLVLTDVAARGIPLEDFNVVVNYSVPTDPEVYFHRYAAGTESQTNKVISLVAPMDIANFHYLKKLGKLEFQKGELPSPEQLFVSKFSQLRSQAVDKGLLNDPALVALVDKVVSDENAKDIVALLLHNTITVLPSLKASNSREENAESAGEDEDVEPQHDDRRGQRGGRGRGNDRHQRGGRRQQHRDEGFDQEEMSGDAHGESEERGSRRGHRRGSGESERGGDERPQRQPRRPVLVDKDARLYVGAGSRQGISPERLTDEVLNICGLGAADIHRVSVRECYSFVDVPEAMAEQVVSKLSEAETPSGGGRYFVKRAVTLSIPREGGEESAPVDGESNDLQGGDEGGAQPTLLAIDDPM